MLSVGAGGWCRPQTDGPALRAMALSKWGMILANAGKNERESGRECERQRQGGRDKFIEDKKSNDRTISLTCCCKRGSERKGEKKTERDIDIISNKEK